MSSVYMYTTYSEPGRNLPGPVERYKTLHCMSSVDRETRYIVAALPASQAIDKPSIVVVGN